MVPLIAGYPSITLCSLDRSGRNPNFHSKADTPERVDPEAVERAIDFVEELVRRIDVAMAPEDATRTPAQAPS